MSSQVSATPEFIYRRTIHATLGVGLLLLLLFVGMAGYELSRKLGLPTTHEAVTVKVENIGTACGVEKKVNKRWAQEGVFSCEEAAKVVAERNGVVTPWRSVESTYALVAYTALGSAQKKLIPVRLLSDQPVAVGAEFAMYADKAKPQLVEFPLRESDTSSFWVMSFIGVAAALFSAGLGWFVAHYNYKSQIKALSQAAARGAETSGTETVNAAQIGPADGIAVAPPLWSRLVRWSGNCVLALGLLMAALAALGNSDGTPDKYRGALIMAILAVGIWRLCAYVASLGVTRAWR